MRNAAIQEGSKKVHSLKKTIVLYYTVDYDVLSMPPGGAGGEGADR